jgi:hypothetical protein|tara:strand:- start:3900 stop:4031 length:132 start_codon:yes stop_codon:yes gene_type:complete
VVIECDDVSKALPQTVLQLYHRHRNIDQDKIMIGEMQTSTGRP